MEEVGCGCIGILFFFQLIVGLIYLLFKLAVFLLFLAISAVAAIVCFVVSVIPFFVCPLLIGFAAFSFYEDLERRGFEGLHVWAILAITILSGASTGMWMQSGSIGLAGTLIQKISIFTSIGCSSALFLLLVVPPIRRQKQIREYRQRERHLIQA